MDMETLLLNCTGFQWDTGNQYKNEEKHGVMTWACEQLFFNEPLLIFEDSKHSTTEPRLYALGKTDQEKTDQDKKLFIAFTIRKQFIRVISARPMSKKERKIYEEA
jgi:uncharacterized protein